ncbi:MAG: ROK family protein [Bacteroidales bacterium]
MKKFPFNSQTSNTNYINRLNKAKVLKLIRNAGEISRADIVKETGISAPTVTRIVDDLIQNEKLVRQVGTGESKGGRPPKIVQFNAENNLIIGLDWGRTHIYATLSNLNAETLYETDTPTEASQDFNKDLQKLYSIIEQLVGKSGIDERKLAGIGIAAAGYVNKEGIIEYSPNFSWKNVDLKKPISEKFNVPVVVNNVSRVMALGELYYGDLNIKDFVFVNLGYGIGAGIIVNGKPLLGFNGISGEFGHTKIFTESRLTRKCVCGKTNCLECFASGRGIEETAREKIKGYPNSLVYQLTSSDPDRIDARLLAKAAAEGDAFARGIFLEAAEILGISIANMTNIINPEAIILGGKVSRAGDFFISRIREVFEQEQLVHTNIPGKLMKTSIPGKTAVKGATALILREVLNLNA